MGKQAVHSILLAKEQNMSPALIQPELSRSKFELENMANLLQSVSFTHVSPLHPIVLSNITAAS